MGIVIGTVALLSGLVGGSVLGFSGGVVAVAIQRREGVDLNRKFDESWERVRKQTEPINEKD